MSIYVYIGPALRCEPDLAESNGSVTLCVQYYARNGDPGGEWKTAGKFPVPSEVWEAFQHYGRRVPG